jgi:hypothetical protein
MIFALVLCMPSLLAAQTTDAPKAEIFLGYSWYHMGGDVITHPYAMSGFEPRAAVQYSGTVHEIPDFKAGAGLQFTYNMNRWFGLTLDGNWHYNDVFRTESYAVGPKFTYRTEHVMPFIEVLYGMQHKDSYLTHDQNNGILIAGGGLDFKVTRHFSVRAIEADYVQTNFSMGLPAGQSDIFHGVRLQSGFIMNFGMPVMEREVTAACSVEPMAVDAGVAVKVMVTPTGFMPRRTVSYSYASTSVKVGGNGGSTSVDTTGLAPGTYTVSAKVWDNGRGSHMRSATCTTSFTINPLPMHPPTLTVSAEPASLTCGDPSTITAVGNSPDNSPLTYQCTANAGHLTGYGPKYTLDTVGLPASTIGVNCTVTDARNLTASASTTVRCSAVKQAAQAYKFGSIDFKNCDQPPTRVDNAAKDELGRYAEALLADPQAKGVVVGYATAEENTARKGRKTPEFAAERAVNTKEYLAVEPVNPTKVDAERIQPRIDTGADQRVDLWIVPAGATFPAGDTTVVDESKVKAVPRGTYRKEVRKDCK